MPYRALYEKKKRIKFFFTNNKPSIDPTIY